MTLDPARVLVVDDDASARTLMRAALQKTGFNVTVADGGREALKQFGAARFDMVMLDVDMPDMSGYEVCAQLRADAGQLLPILMVTGMDDVRSVERAYQSGATDFLSKPINWALIGHRVKYLLRGYQTLIDLGAEQARNTAILQAIPDLLFEMNLEGRHLECHTPRADLLPVPVEQLLGRTVAKVLPGPAAQVWMEALHAANANGASTGLQYELELAGGRFWFELSVSRKARQEGEQARFIVLSRNITERKDAEQKILRLAYFDALTRLPNRQSFLHRVDREIKRAHHDGTQLGVLFMDLDGFKNINDTLGHSLGDQILQRAANRLRRGVRPADLVSRPAELEMRGAEPGSEVEFARLGGDEFTALILDLKGPEGALVVSRRILELMRRPYTIDGRDLLLTASIGIALYPDDGLDAATLLKHADTAMYHAKDSGRDNCQFYSSALTQVAVRRMELEGDMRLALERDEFRLVYQPLLDAATGGVRAVEALIRWERPGYGLVSPVEFIGVAERSGLILDIGQWVLRTACSDAAQWQRKGRAVNLAVNLSPLQFQDPELLAIVQGALANSGLPAHLLELELTEGAVMADTVATMVTLNAFRAHGIRIALDDFGTGYSSLSYLKRMPLSTLKIDRSFVTGLPQDSENHAIVRAILVMADSLGLGVTAEGVETVQQAQALKAMNCASLQGYYFSLPVEAGNIPDMLDRHWRLD
jgi:PAS domain S-box-containing protein